MVRTLTRTLQSELDVKKAREVELVEALGRDRVATQALLSKAADAQSAELKAQQALLERAMRDLRVAELQSQTTILKVRWGGLWRGEQEEIIVALLESGEVF